jgi:hypothetical protein
MELRDLYRSTNVARASKPSIFVTRVVRSSDGKEKCIIFVLKHF